MGNGEYVEKQLMGVRYVPLVKAELPAACSGIPNSWKHPLVNSPSDPPEEEEPEKEPEKVVTLENGQDELDQADCVNPQASQPAALLETTPNKDAVTAQTQCCEVNEKPNDPLLFPSVPHADQG